MELETSFSFSVAYQEILLSYLCSYQETFLSFLFSSPVTSPDWVCKSGIKPFCTRVNNSQF